MYKIKDEWFYAKKCNNLILFTTLYCYYAIHLNKYT